MKRKVLIVGLGIGKLYEDVCKNMLYSKNNYRNLEIETVTVDKDPDKNSDFATISAAIDYHKTFDMSIICLPNYLHKDAALKLIPVSTIVLVEKPGVSSTEEWKQLYRIRGNCFMIKNNMYRNIYEGIQKNLSEFKTSIRDLKLIWINRNRVPYPGGWFTNKELAFSGVSSDLMVHLLSIYCMLVKYPTNKSIDTILVKQNYNMDTIDGTDYGHIIDGGIYNVDDYCQVRIDNIIMETAWKAPVDTDVFELHFEFYDNKPDIVYELGLCPVNVYDTMLYRFLIGDFDASYQYMCDVWIHEQLETIKNIFYDAKNIT